MLAAKLSGICIIFFLVISVTSIPVLDNAFAQDQPRFVKFSGKGLVVANRDFRDTVVWTIIHGTKGTLIIQSPQGRGIAHLSLVPSNTCQSSLSICSLATVSDTNQIPIFQVGDTARFSIDVDSKQETISVLSGVISGFNVTFNLSKTWSNIGLTVKNSR